MCTEDLSFHTTNFSVWPMGVQNTYQALLENVHLCGQFKLLLPHHRCIWGLAMDYNSNIFALLLVN